MNGLGTVLITIFLFGMLVTGMIWGGIELLSSDELRVEHKLEPISVEIYTKDGASDTTYVYQLP